LPEFEVWAVQPPGRGTRLREPLVTDPDVALDAVVAALGELPGTGGRLVLFGHSLGAAMAHLLALRIPEQVDLLALASWPVPSRLPLWPAGLPASALDAPELIRFVRGLESPGRHELDDPARQAILLPPLKADLELGDVVAARRTQGPLPMPVLTVSGRDDPAFTPADVAAWRGLAEFTEEVRLPGGHFAVFEQVRTVSKAITGCLDRPKWTDSARLSA
jgi:pyochelin biosynthetic protein PchC